MSTFDNFMETLNGLPQDTKDAILAAHRAVVDQQRSADTDRVLRTLRAHADVTALLAHNVSERSTKHVLRKSLAAAIETIDELDDGSADVISDFRERLTDVLSRLGDGGYASNRVKTAVQHALEMIGVRTRGVVALRPNPVPDPCDDESDDDDEPDDEPPPTGEEAPAAERAQLAPSDDAPQVVKDAFRLIMSSANMRRNIRFDLTPFLLRVHRNVETARAKAASRARLSLSPHDTVKMFGGGRTQARKTPLKAVQFVLCRMMGVPTVLLTTNVAGREDLFKKFSELLAEIDVPTPPLRADVAEYTGRQYEYQKVDGVLKLVAVGREAGRRGVQGLLSVDTIAQQHRGWALSQLQLGACIVSNNTSAAINKVSSLVNEARGSAPAAPMQFMLTIDEADDFYRTDGDREQPIKLEFALDGLRRLGPLVCFEVSATLLAAYMELHRQGGADAVAAADLWYVEPCDDYVGAELLMPPQDPRGEYQFLHEDDLKKSNTYADEKVRSMYADAAAHPRSLLLDATTASVTAANQVGIYDKAKLVQKLHPRTVVVVVSGSSIAWWTARPRSNRPQDARGVELLGKARVVGNVIAKIDKHYPDRPIFVFGYSQMVRGVSYRSRHRVPSHFVLLYKSGMPLCRLVQAAGRAMGEQARQLRANGFNHVLMLTQPRDYDAICAYPEFLKAIKQRMAGGASLADALGATTYDSKFNAFSTPHALGAKKLHLDSYVQETLQFAPTTEPIGLGNATLDRELGCEGRGLRRAALEAMLEMGSLDEEYAVGGKELHEELSGGEYDDYFGDADTSPTVAEVTKVLKELCHRPAHREPVLECNGRAGKACKFFVNEEGLDALPGRAGLPHAQQPQPQPSHAASDDMDAESDAPPVPATPLVRREATAERNERMSRRERDLKAAEEAARAALAHGEALLAELAGGSSPTAPGLATGGRPRRGAAAAAQVRLASCATQLEMDERCDERPEDLLPAHAAKRPCRRLSPEQ